MKAVVVTTGNHGVFFGYIDSDKPQTKDEITLTQCRNCIYWHNSLHGFMGLASQGPNEQCKIGGAVSSVKLFNVTAILDASDEAVKAWESEPWN